jgi:hypothetical protein
LAVGVSQGQLVRQLLARAEMRALGHVVKWHGKHLLEAGQNPINHIHLGGQYVIP